MTRDAKAARAAIAERRLCTDVLGLAIDLITLQAVSESDAALLLSVWDDRSQQICRPRDWKGFAETAALRRALGFPFFKTD